jgi:predicted ABC-type ATPase
LNAPFLLMVAGPNGSGKTTLTRMLRERGVDFGEYINPDDIALTLEGSYEVRVAEAQHTADRRRDECITARRSFSFETVMSHSSKIDILKRAKAAGFVVHLYFVGIDDPRINVDRVALRVAQGGHDVPPDRVMARWHRTMGFLADAVMAADVTRVFDNSESGPTNAPRLVARVETSRGAGLVDRQYPPIPEWVRRFLLDRLGIVEKAS